MDYIAHQASLSFTISQSLFKFMCIELMMLSNHLIPCCSLLLSSIFPSIRFFSKESALRIRWPKYWSFNFSISPSSEYSQLISFKLANLISLQSKGLSRVSSWTTALWNGRAYIHNSMKLWAMPCRATQDGQVVPKSSDKTWSSGEETGYLLHGKTPWTVWKGKRLLR